MEITTELLQRFVGGQAAIQNLSAMFIFRGEIRKIDIEGSMLVINYAWLAKGSGFPEPPKRWIKIKAWPYAVDMLTHAAADIGPSPEGGGNRICLTAPIIGETIVLYPPDGSKLDAGRVEGLELPRLIPVE